MNVFNFITPTGQQVELTGPAGSTYDQALAVFNQQSATGSLIGLRSGDILNSLIQAKGGLATALSQVTSSITPSTLSQIAGVVTKIPNLPASNPTTISTFVNTPVLVSNTVGPLSTTQVQGLMASTAAAVNQNSTDVTNEKGLGTYGLTPNQLQQAGLIKPGTAELINQDPANTVSTLSSPTVWTGKGGADSLDSVLANDTLQAAVQQDSMATSYDQLTQLGVVSDTTVNTTLDPYAGLTAEQIQLLGGADPTDPIIRYRLGLPALTDSTSTVGSIVNNAANFGVGPTLSWLNNTVGGSEIGQLTTSAINSIFGQSFGSANKSVSGGGNPLQTGVQTPKGYSNTTNRAVIDASFNAIIGNNKVPANIFANPGLGIDSQKLAGQVNTINQSASILLTNLASTAAGVAALSQVPGANQILTLLQSGAGLYQQVQGAAKLLDQVKDLPGVGELLKDLPGSSQVLADLQGFKEGIAGIGKDIYNNVADVFSDLDIKSLSDFDTSALLDSAKEVIADAEPLIQEGLEYLASFW